MRNEERKNLLFLDDIQTAMSRIAEYIKGYDFEHFKRDYKTVYLPENKIQIDQIIDQEK